MFAKLLASEEDCLKTTKLMEQLKQFPIVMYGAGIYARSLSRYLKQYFSLDIDIYFVDEQYSSSKCAVDNVINFDQIKQKFKKFNLICGFDCKPSVFLYKVKQLNCEQINSSCILDHSFWWESFDKFDFSYILENQRLFENIYNSLADKISKDVLINYINCKLTINLSYLQNITSFPQYFPDDLPAFYPSSNDVFVDGGAYDGDTLRLFLSKVKTGKCKKYYAFEPEQANYEKLSAYVKHQNLAFVEPAKVGLWSHKGTLSFLGEMGTSSAISQAGEIKIDVNTIDNLETDVTYIKMDIEGAEFEALKGATKTIRTKKPKLAISIYYHPQHLTEIPLFIKSLCPDYEFYLRIHSFYTRELVLYAVARC
jgi:FkbM family methyltransferase